MMSPPKARNLNRSIGVGSVSAGLATKACSVRGSVAGVETVGTLGV